MRVNLAIICGNGVMEAVALDFDGTKAFGGVFSIPRDEEDGVITSYVVQVLDRINKIDPTYYICNLYVQDLHGKVHHFYICPKGSINATKNRLPLFAVSDKLHRHLHYAYHKIYLN